MKSFVAVVLLVLFISALGYAAPPAKYALYYIDTTHNVSKIGIDSTGHPVGKPKRLTTRGTYDAFSVSPDERHVLGIRFVRDLGGLWQWDQYLEHTGKGPIGHIRNDSITDTAIPYALWLPKTDSLVYVVPQQVNSPQYIVYSIRQGRTLFDEINVLGPVSADQRYAFVTEDVGCAAEGPAGLRVLDLTTGKLAAVRKAQFEEAIEWSGDSHRFAFIGSDRRLWAGEVNGTGSDLHVNVWNVTRFGGCSRVRYVRGQGIYFEQKASDGKMAAYYTADLKTISKTKPLPETPWQETDKQHQAERNLIDRIVAGAKRPTDTPWRDNALLTPDHKLLVCPFVSDDSKMPELRVLTRTGHSVTIANGKRPMWSTTPGYEVR